MQGYERVDEDQVRCLACGSNVRSYPSHLRRHEATDRHRSAVDALASSSPSLLTSSEGSTSSATPRVRPEQELAGLCSEPESDFSFGSEDESSETEAIFEEERTEAAMTDSSAINDFDLEGPFSDSDWSNTDSEDEELPGPNMDYAPFSSLEVSGDPHVS